MRSIYSLFHCKITLHVSGAFYTHHQEYRKLSRRPLVQVICRDSLEVAASNPLEIIHSQTTTTLHHGQIKTVHCCISLDIYIYIYIYINKMHGTMNIKL
jgi:hypothetical protein